MRRFSFELPNDLVVKPVDRVEMILYIKTLNKSVLIHPFVWESATKWLIIGGVDMVRYGLLNELNDKLISLYGTAQPLNDLDSTPVHHRAHLSPYNVFDSRGPGQQVMSTTQLGNRNSSADVVESVLRGKE
jgi:hypothetical protein